MLLQLHSCFHRRLFYKNTFGGLPDYSEPYTTTLQMGRSFRSDLHLAVLSISVGQLLSQYSVFFLRHNTQRGEKVSSRSRFQPVFVQLLAQKTDECALTETAASNWKLSKQGLLQTTSACEAEAGLFSELLTFVLCLNSHSRRKMGMKAAFILWSKIQRSPWNCPNNNKGLLYKSNLTFWITCNYLNILTRLQISFLKMLLMTIL